MGKHIFSAPTTVNLEITEACNVKCRHCYNFWREESAGRYSLDREKIDKFAEMFQEAGVFHVILSGGEPFAKFDLLVYSIRLFSDAGLSVSCNSNLMLATEENCQRLMEAGLDHILTSWCSSDPVEMDYIMGMVGSYEKVVAGIKAATAAGIRVSVNTIVSNNNKNRVYDSGKFLHSLGITKFFAHRTIPPAYDREDKDDQHLITKEDAIETLDELLQLKEDTGMVVGTLISYPLCMLGDLEKYQDFVGRGCPSQRGRRFSINVDGQAHSCVMEDKAYGNVFEIGLKEAYLNTKSWHDTSYRYEGCKGCHYLEICESGCRMSALAATGEMNGRDPLMVGKEAFVKPYTFQHDPKVLASIERGAALRAPNRLRFRKEDGYYLLNIRWGNTIIVETQVAEFLMRCIESENDFTLKDAEHLGAETLADLFFKDALESDEIMVVDERNTKGVSFDPSTLVSAR